VQEWCRTHPGVQAELHAQRQERWMGTTDRLRALLPQALEVLAEELQGENRLQAAVHVLKACRLYGAEWPAGPTEAADIVVAEKEHVQNRQRRLRLANLY